ncbi:putative autophagy-related 12 variant 1 [Toxoplasma gondii CAST]|uniref:Ubiquitin-like protein ATG12 n=1 Tax=Toxoplasma gondii CAST TaxID=943122 RepID=A0A3R8AL41_TOXGO|nr:putative autophagy-related 12 variant 1 [Toxoplasma gondii CAST]
MSPETSPSGPAGLCASQLASEPHSGVWGVSQPSDAHANESSAGRRNSFSSASNVVDPSSGRSVSASHQGDLGELEALSSTSSSGEASSLLDSDSESASLLDSGDSDSDPADDGFFKLKATLGRDSQGASVHSSEPDEDAAKGRSSASSERAFPYRDSSGERSKAVPTRRSESREQEASNTPEDPAVCGEETTSEKAEKTGQREDPREQRKFWTSVSDADFQKSGSETGRRLEVGRRAPPSACQESKEFLEARAAADLYLSPSAARSGSSVRPQRHDGMPASSTGIRESQRGTVFTENHVLPMQASQTDASASRNVASRPEMCGPTVTALSSKNVKTRAEGDEENDSEGRLQTPRRGHELRGGDNTAADSLEEDEFESPREDLDTRSEDPSVAGTQSESSLVNRRNNSHRTAFLCSPNSQPDAADLDAREAPGTPCSQENRKSLSSLTGEGWSQESEISLETNKAGVCVSASLAKSEEEVTRGNPHTADAFLFPAPSAAREVRRDARLGRQNDSSGGEDGSGGEDSAGRRLNQVGQSLETELQQQAQHEMKTKQSFSDLETPSLSENDTHGEEEWELRWVPSITPDWDVESHFFQLRDFKVHISLSNVGGAARLRVSRFKVDGYQRFDTVITFLKKALKRDHLYVYVNNFIQPQPDEFVADLFKAFGVGGSLMVSYCYTPAY